MPKTTKAIASAEWRAANPEKKKAYSQDYYQRTKSVQIAKALARKVTHRFDQLLCRRAEIANKRYPGRITTNDLRVLLATRGAVCHWCGKELVGDDLTLEHLEPRNDPACLTWACRACNAAKTAVHGKPRQTPEERAAKRKAYKAEWYQRTKHKSK